MTRHKMNFILFKNGKLVVSFRLKPQTEGEPIKGCQIVFLSPKMTDFTLCDRQGYRLELFDSHYLVVSHLT